MTQLSRSDVPEPVFDPNVGILLRDPYFAISTELLRRLTTAGYDDLRPAHLAVFQHIDPDGSRVTELARRAQMAKPSMSYLVEELERRGYVDRIDDPADGRARLVRLTDRGWAQVRDALTIIATMEVELATRLGARRWETLRTTLADVRTATQEWHDA